MYIKIEVAAGAKEEPVKKISPDLFEVRVREKAERNMANRRVLELIRREFQKSGARGVMVKIISGHKSPSKIISVEMK